MSPCFRHCDLHQPLAEHFRRRLKPETLAGLGVEALKRDTQAAKKILEQHVRNGLEHTLDALTAGEDAGTT